MINANDIKEIKELIIEQADASAIIDFFQIHLDNVAEKAKELAHKDAYMNALNIELTTHWSRVQSLEFAMADCRSLANTINAIYIH